MPTWGDILRELEPGLQAKDPNTFDKVRRKYLKLLHQKTGRNIILYATKWTQPSQQISAGDVSITEADIHGLMEVVHGLKGEKLDLIIHSPGGSAEATEAIVSYLRTKFSDIRVIVPQAAMSAATMLACAGNSIVMGKHSSLGPIDPQLNVGGQFTPAQAILDQFKMAKDECVKDAKNLAPWVPILNQYGPALLVVCQNHINLAKQLVTTWLNDYMFKGDVDADAKATRIAEELGSHNSFKSHGRHINRESARHLAGEHGLKIEDLEADQEFQDLVLSVFHSTMHTLASTATVKIIENQEGRAYIGQVQVVVMNQQAPPDSPAQPVPAPALPGPPRLPPSLPGARQPRKR